MPDISLVSANLATVCIESLLYGVFFILFVASTYLRVHQHRMLHTRRRRSPSILMSPMFCAALCLFASITIHWVLTIARLFQALVYFQGGSSPVRFYSDLSQPTEIAKTAFLLVVLVTGDVMIIYRLWVVWNGNKLVIAFPSLTLLGLIACGTSLTYQLSLSSPGENVFVSELSRWATSGWVFALGTNIYSTVMLAWRIWTTQKARSFMSILATLAESAALYTSWTIFFFAAYESRSNIQFTAVDTWPTILGIAYMLISVRIGLDWTRKSAKGSSKPLTELVFQSPDMEMSDTVSDGIDPLPVSMDTMGTSADEEVDSNKDYPRRHPEA